MSPQFSILQAVQPKASEGQPAPGPSGGAPSGGPPPGGGLVMFLPLLPHYHPRMASEYDGPGHSRRLQPPGFLALHYGYRTPLTTILAHAVYGAILGSQLAVR